MNEDYSNLIKNFSEILKEKNIDLNTIIPNNSSSSNNRCENAQTSQNQDIQVPSHIPDFDINFEDILKIKSLLEKINSSENTNRNTLLHSLKPFLPANKKEKLEQLIKISSLLTALELLENKNILGLELSSNTIIIIILILIIL